MGKKQTRLQQAESKYCDQLHEWLTNPKNENLPNEIIESQLKVAFNEFLDALVFDEEECAQFISEGRFLDEMEFLPLIFDRFRSAKIYDAICANCKIAFSHKHFTESPETESKRRLLLDEIAKKLHFQ